MFLNELFIVFSLSYNYHLKLNIVKKICTNINPDKNLDGPMDLRNLEEK